MRDCGHDYRSSRAAHANHGHASGELVMNHVDYQMGGMTAPSIASWMFWRGIIFAVPAGFLAAWPVNHWLLKRELKACH